MCDVTAVTGGTGRETSEEGTERFKIQNNEKEREQTHTVYKVNSGVPWIKIKNVPHCFRTSETFQ